jgi:hypothetical protein
MTSYQFSYLSEIYQFVLDHWPKFSTSEYCAYGIENSQSQ